MKRRDARQADLAPPLRILVENLPIYISQDCMDDTVMKCLRECRCSRTFDLAVADLLVVADISEISLEVHWSAMLKGSGICTIELIRSHGKRGPVLTYIPAVSVTRTCWASLGFRTAYPMLWKVLSIVVSSPSSKWRMAKSQATFLEQISKRKRRSR